MKGRLATLLTLEVGSNGKISPHTDAGSLVLLLLQDSSRTSTICLVKTQLLNVKKKRQKASLRNQLDSLDLCR